MSLENASVVFLDQPIAEGCGDRAAFVTPAGRCTYHELHALADRAGQALRVRGVEPEQRVALLLADGPGFAATFFGALRIGSVAVPLGTRLAPDELRRVLADCRAKLLVGDPALLDAARSVFAELGVATTSFEALVADASPAGLRPDPVGLDAMAFWLYTSGTTGSPRAVVHPHRNLLACHHYAVDVLGVNSADRIFVTSKLFFAYALGNALLIPLFARASAYLSPDWADPGCVSAVLGAYRPTLFFSVPTFYAALLRADLPADSFASVRACVSAGERLPAEIYDAWRRRFGIEILDGLGATETIFMVLSNRPGQSRAGTTGMPVPGTEVRLLDADDRPVADGEQGELWVKTSSVAAGYWNRLDQSRRTFVGEWFRTGDLYRREADGWYVHCGRDDDRFKVAGQWVAPVELEAVVRRHPAVLDTGVVGAEEGRGLVKPFVFVVPRDSAAATTLRAEVRTLIEQSLARHQWPRDILIVPELPRTATGKLQRYRLREEIAVRQAGLRA